MTLEDEEEEEEEEFDEDKLTRRARDEGTRHQMAHGFHTAGGGGPYVLQPSSHSQARQQHYDSSGYYNNLCHAAYPHSVHLDPNHCKYI